MAKKQKSNKSLKQQTLEDLEAQRETVEALSEQELEAIAGGFVQLNTGVVRNTGVVHNTGLVLNTGVVRNTGVVHNAGLVNNTGVVRNTGV